MIRNDYMSFYDQCLLNFEESREFLKSTIKRIFPEILTGEKFNKSMENKLVNFSYIKMYDNIYRVKFALQLSTIEIPFEVEMKNNVDIDGNYTYTLQFLNPCSGYEFDFYYQGNAFNKHMRQMLQTYVTSFI